MSIIILRLRQLKVFTEGIGPMRPRVVPVVAVGLIVSVAVVRGSRPNPGAADPALARREGGSNVGLLDHRRQKTGGHHAEPEFVDSMVGEKFRTPRLAGNSVR